MAIDLSAVFDTVDWSILLDCLQYWFGITGSALKWFEQYLRPRYCKVNVGKAYSKNHKLECSVPQGSCAGPILYTVLCLDLPGSNRESIIKYIDTWSNRKP